MRKIIGSVCLLALLAGGAFYYYAQPVVPPAVTETAPVPTADNQSAAPADTAATTIAPTTTDSTATPLPSAEAIAKIDPAVAFPQAMAERSIGKSDAPVVIEEFFAFTCPHCAQLHKDILPLIKKDYVDTGKLRLIFRDYIFNEAGLKASMVARCVDPASYEEFVTTLFQMQMAWLMPQTGEQVLRQLAGFAGLGGARYDACLNYKALSDFLLEERVKAVNVYQIDQTPTMVIRGSLERITGAESYNDYKTVFDRQYTRETSGAQ